MQCLRILQHPRCIILVSQSSTAASKNKANACGLDTIGVLIKEPQTMGREISRGGGLGHWHSDTIPFSFAALCFLGPLAFPLPLWRNLCACPCWVSKVKLQEISIYLHKQEAKKKKGGSVCHYHSSAALRFPSSYQINSLWFSSQGLRLS